MQLAAGFQLVADVQGDGFVLVRLGRDVGGRNDAANTSEAASNVVRIVFPLGRKARTTGGIGSSRVDRAWPSLTSEPRSLEFVSADGGAEREFFSGFAGLPAARDEAAKPGSGLRPGLAADAREG